MRRVAALKGGGGNPQQVQVAAVLNVLNEHRDKIKAPGLLIGFRLDNPKQAEAQPRRSRPCSPTLSKPPSRSRAA